MKRFTRTGHFEFKKCAGNVSVNSGTGRNFRKRRKKPVGSEFYNTLACLVGDYFMKCGRYPLSVRFKDEGLPMQTWISQVIITVFSATNMI